MDSAIIGFIGVVIGASITVVYDLISQRKKRAKDVEYLAIRVACDLDRFAYGCIEVVKDDGTYRGQYDVNGYANIQVDTPNFEPFKFDVEWKSLPHTLMYGVLNLPNTIENANRYIDSAFEYVATPPDRAEGFEERQLQFAQIGLTALDLAAKLRSIAKLPPVVHPDYWNPTNIFNNKVIEIERYRNKVADSQQKLINKTQLDEEQA